MEVSTQNITISTKMTISTCTYHCAYVYFLYMAGIASVIGCHPFDTVKVCGTKPSVRTSSEGYTIWSACVSVTQHLTFHVLQRMLTFFSSVKMLRSVTGILVRTVRGTNIPGPPDRNLQDNVQMKRSDPGDDDGPGTLCFLCIYQASTGLL